MKEAFEKLGFARENWAIRGEKGVQEKTRHRVQTVSFLPKTGSSV